MDLSNVTTKQLVAELSKREAVAKYQAEPYEDFKIVIGDNEISDKGPAVILQIWD